MARSDAGTAPATPATPPTSCWRVTPAHSSSWPIAAHEGPGADDERWEGALGLAAAASHRVLREPVSEHHRGDDLSRGERASRQRDGRRDLLDPPPVASGSAGRGARLRRRDALHPADRDRTAGLGPPAGARARAPAL